MDSNENRNNNKFYILVLIVVVAFFIFGIKNIETPQLTTKQTGKQTFAKKNIIQMGKIKNISNNAAYSRNRKCSICHEEIMKNHDFDKFQYCMAKCHGRLDEYLKDKEDKEAKELEKKNIIKIEEKKADEYERKYPILTDNMDNNRENIQVVSIYEAEKNYTCKDEPNAGNRKGVVNINITDKTKPVTVLLTSYEPVIWNIKTKEGVKINKIYLSSYYKSKIIAPNNTKVIRLNKRFYLSEDDYYKIEDEFGKNVETYQYKYNGDTFNIDGLSGKNYKVFVKHPSVDNNSKVVFNATNSTITGINSYTNKYVNMGKYYFEAQLLKDNNAHPAANVVGIISDNTKESKQEACRFTIGGSKCQMVGIGLMDIKDGDIIGIAFDMDAGILKYSVNGVWNSQVQKFRNDGREYCPAIDVMHNNKWIANFGARKFKYPIPKGYKPFDTYSAKQLALTGKEPEKSQIEKEMEVRKSMADRIRSKELINEKLEKELELRKKEIELNNREKEIDLRRKELEEELAKLKNK